MKYLGRVSAILFFHGEKPVSDTPAAGESPVVFDWMEDEQPDRHRSRGITQM